TPSPVDEMIAAASSWLHRIEAQFTALRYFALDGTDHATHQEQASMIRRYIIWRNNHAYDERLRQVVARATLPEAAQGKRAKTGIDKQFQDQVRDMIKPGTSALFLMLDKGDPDNAVGGDEQVGRTVLKTSLFMDDEKAFQNAPAWRPDGRSVVTEDAGEMFSPAASAVTARY